MAAPRVAPPIASAPKSGEIGLKMAASMCMYGPDGLHVSVAAVDASDGERGV
jgi:hypothetical protein